MSTLKNNEKTLDELKRERILEGAKQVFLAYGYSRTTMDDIARAVDVSRPALYLLFKNKADIFRAVGWVFLNESRTAARRELKEDGPFDVRLMAALDCAVFQLFSVIDESPHGEEIIDMENRIASDIVAEWRQCLVDAVAERIGEEARRRNVRLEDRGFSARSLAEMMFDVFEGLKVRGLCGSQDARDYASQFIGLIELALRKE